VETLGWSGVLVNLAIIAAAFTAAGFLVLLIDQRLGRGRRQDARAADRASAGS